MGVTQDAPYVELNIECRDLRNQKMLPGLKSDPFVSLYVASPDGDFVWYDKTETVKNSSHPCFIKSLDLPYRTERSFQYHLSFEVHSRSSNSDEVHMQKFLGVTPTTELSRILKKEFFTLELPLRDPIRENKGKESSPTAIVMSTMSSGGGDTRKNPKSGYLLVYAEIVEPKMYTQMYSFAISLANVVPPEPKKKRFGSSKRRRGVFLKISRAARHRPGFFTPVFCSEVLEGKTIKFEAFDILSEKLDGDNDTRNLRFTLYEHYPNGNHLSFGHFETCMAKLKYSIVKGSVVTNMRPEPHNFSGYELEASLILTDVILEEKQKSFSLNISEMEWRPENV
eukprot:Plantae.Rhodophyta-Hildenbrandia_rubra.ctg13884.p1 GENE.Plantae.Rhodophyta-Hildenbrandia_rubra.ctg13884~~Plantae.Rhodophyta-Hildenbrandia_rubra.ctg13884.p1  ORF type:complete len:390 (+),score=36.92 Plantae.Rhodophyta-Hildenbrandia_rubra.ctg13884:154-1170(+)